MKLRTDFVGLLGARGAKLIVGLATMFVYARFFGVSATYDAWVWSLGIVNAAGMMLFGPITETIRVSYTTVDHQEGRAEAEQYLATVSAMMIGAASLVAVAGATILPMAATTFVQQQSEQGQASIFFLYALAPSLVIAQVVAVLTAQLNCRGRVYPPEIAGIVGGAVGVLFITAFPQWPATWLLLGSYYIGLIAPLLVGASFWPELLHAFSRLELAAFRRHGREALVFSLPLFLPYALGQVSGLIERQFALQAGTGTLAVLSYAFFARSTMQAVFTAALSALAVPALARAWDVQDRHPFRVALRHWTHQCLLLVTMSMIALFGLSDIMPIILFGNKITVGPQLLLGELLRWYAIAIIGVVMYLIGGSALLAARKSKAYALLGAGVNTASTLLLVALFPVIGIVAAPIALGVSVLIVSWLMFYTVDRADAGWVLWQTAIRTIAVVAAGCAVRLVDMLAEQQAQIPILGRLALDLAAIGMLCGLWWLIDLWLARHGARETLGVST